MRSRSNSRSRRSLTTSMWSRPRKPVRKPKPSATLVSGVYTMAGSLSLSLSSASRRFSKSLVSIGKMPVYTMGFTSR